MLAGGAGWLECPGRKLGGQRLSPLLPHMQAQRAVAAILSTLQRASPDSPPHHPGLGQHLLSAGGTSLTTDRTPVGLQLALSV